MTKYEYVVTVEQVDGSERQAFTATVQEVGTDRGAKEIGRTAAMAVAQAFVEIETAPEPKPRKVKIHGPNLQDQSRGTFQVHSADCRDNARVRYLGGTVGEEMEPMTDEIETKADAVAFVYEDQLNEGSPWEGCRDDFDWKPCCADIPDGERPDWVTA